MSRSVSRTARALRSWWRRCVPTATSIATNVHTNPTTGCLDLQQQDSYILFQVGSRLDRGVHLSPGGGVNRPLRCSNAVPLVRDAGFVSVRPRRDTDLGESNGQFGLTARGPSVHECFVPADSIMSKYGVRCKTRPAPLRGRQSGSEIFSISSQSNVSFAVVRVQPQAAPAPPLPMPRPQTKARAPVSRSHSCPTMPP